MIEWEGEIIEIEDDYLPEATCEEEEEEETRTETLKKEEHITLTEEEAKRYKEYIARHNKHLKQYVPHPRDYSKVNFKKSNPGYKNISQLSNGDFECSRQRNVTKYRR